METPQLKNPKFYDVEQIADCVDVSTRTVRRWIDRGLRIAHRINGFGADLRGGFSRFLARKQHRKSVGNVSCSLTMWRAS
jgi:predicted DNA-binding protein (UPF0278 family)